MAQRLLACAFLTFLTDGEELQGAVEQTRISVFGCHIILAQSVGDF